MANITLDIIRQRRSVRRFKPEQVSEADLQALLDAALHAPSAMNQQKWHFTVVQNAGLLDLMVEIMKENIHATGIESLIKRADTPGYSTFHHAPTVIMISGPEGSQVDCGAAAENILIAAESMGLGSCIMTSPTLLFTSERGNSLRGRLGIPQGYNHVCTVVLGYKDETPAMPPRKPDVVTHVR